MARTVMSASAALLLVVGAALLFLPQEVATVLHLQEGADAALPLAGAGALAFAALDWVGRAAVYGGVYGRPIVVGNFVFAAIASLTLLRLVVDTPTAAGWVLVAAFLVYWLAYAQLLYRPPFDRTVDDAGA